MTISLEEKKTGDKDKDGDSVCKKWGWNDWMGVWWVYYKQSISIYDVPKHMFQEMKLVFFYILKCHQM